MKQLELPPPWTVEEMNSACFIVRDKNGSAVATRHTCSGKAVLMCGCSTFGIRATSRHSFDKLVVLFDCVCISDEHMGGADVKGYVVQRRSTEAFQVEARADPWEH